MLSGIHIKQFRGFEDLVVQPLSRVNVFVGANNAGKTALLEAIELLTRGEAPAALFGILARREERVFRDFTARSDQFPYDVSSLFNGRSLEPGSEFSVRATKPVGRRYRCVARQLTDDETAQRPFLDVEDDVDRLVAGVPPELLAEPLALEIATESGSSRIRLDQRARRATERSSSSSVQFLGTGLPTLSSMSRLWDQIALTPREEQVISTLQLIEPDVKRLAFLGAQPRQPSIYLLLQHSNQRVLLGSMGEGIRRLLGLALAVGNTERGGALLVDEIATGLHHTVMTPMWTLVLRAAEEFDFQVFATTHSLDCLMSLAQVATDSPSLAEQLAVHRLERNRGSTVHYSASELATAVQHELEVR